MFNNSAKSDIKSTEMNGNCVELAVDVRKAYFEYKTNVTVLDDLTLQVPKGKIFALLGPNGIGKTTLIRCILGRLALKRGSIDVFGRPSGSADSDIPGPGVGYMPQELALIEEFTTNEMLRYYGMIYHLKGQELLDRVKQLMEILHLDDNNRPISGLSGGQQRRVSIAVTMIHRPKLIILDEPTVGVDSLLRARIWHYLEDMCRMNGQTVMITTHYIEEARSAATVAFMNYGTILKQDEPGHLMRRYNCQTLESVFLRLCQKKRSNKKKNNEPDIADISSNELDKPMENTISKHKRTRSSTKGFDFGRVKALLWKYYIQSSRKPVFLYLFYLMPFWVLTCLRFSLGGYPRHIGMVVHNADADPLLSQVLIDNIDREHIDLRFADSNETAIESVVNGTNYMAVVFGQNFSDTFGYRLTDVTDITEEELELSEIKAYVDFSNAAMGIFVLKYLLRAFNKLLQSMSGELGRNAERFFHIIAVEEPIYGEFEFHLAEVLGPGILMALCHILPMIMSSLQILYDKMNVTLERMIVAGVRPIEIFSVHVIESALLIATQLVFTMLIHFGLWGNKQLGSYLDAFLLLYLLGLQGMSIGFFLSLLVKDEVGTLACTASFVLPLWISSGVLWPIEAIPEFYRQFSLLGPMTRPLLALRAIILRGWGPSHPVVMSGYVVCIAYVLVLSLLDIIFFTKLTK